MWRGLTRRCRAVKDKFAKAVIEYAGRGQYLHSCDSCSRVTTEVASIFTGPNGEHMDLCGRCLDADGWGSSFVFRRAGKVKKNGAT